MEKEDEREVVGEVVCVTMGDVNVRVNRFLLKCVMCVAHDLCICVFLFY